MLKYFFNPAVFFGVSVGLAVREITGCSLLAQSYVQIAATMLGLMLGDLAEERPRTRR
ncbi:hypothetical protein D3C87_777440 [compost metagenome]